MYFVLIVLFVCNGYCFSFVGLRDHCIVLVELMVDVFAMFDCLLCVIFNLQQPATKGMYNASYSF